MMSEKIRPHHLERVVRVQCCARISHLRWGARSGCYILQQRRQAA